MGHYCMLIVQTTYFFFPWICYSLKQKIDFHLIWKARRDGNIPFADSLLQCLEQPRLSGWNQESRTPSRSVWGHEPKLWSHHLLPLGMCITREPELKWGTQTSGGPTGVLTPLWKVCFSLFSSTVLIGIQWISLRTWIQVICNKELLEVKLGLWSTF